MSLHGDIRVNSREIGYWSARRLQHPPAEVNEYAVRVDLDSRFVEFHVVHTFNDGPLVLASKVLAQAATELGPD